MLAELFDTTDPYLNRRFFLSLGLAAVTLGLSVVEGCAGYTTIGFDLIFVVALVWRPVGTILGPLLAFVFTSFLYFVWLHSCTERLRISWRESLHNPVFWLLLGWLALFLVIHGGPLSLG